MCPCGYPTATTNEGSSRHIIRFSSDCNSRAEGVTWLKTCAGLKRDVPSIYYILCALHLERHNCSYFNGYCLQRKTFIFFQLLFVHAMAHTRVQNASETNYYYSRKNIFLSEIPRAPTIESSSHATIINSEIRIFCLHILVSGFPPMYIYRYIICTM